MEYRRGLSGPALQLHQPLQLPLAFCGGSGEAGSLRGVHDRAEGVTGGVGRSGGVARGARRSAGGIVGAFSRGGMSGHRRLARRADPYLAPRESASGLDGLTWTVVLGAVLLEQRQHALGAVGGPDGEGRLVLAVQEFGQQTVSVRHGGIVAAAEGVEGGWWVVTTVGVSEPCGGRTQRSAPTGNPSPALPGRCGN